MSTFFGSPSNFAFECKENQNFAIVPSIHLCIWIAGEPIGNFDCAINVENCANSFDEFLSLAPLRAQHDLAKLDAYFVLYSLAAPPLFGREEACRRLQERGYGEPYTCSDVRAFDIAKAGGDAFADVQAMLVGGHKGTERFLWSEDPIAISASFRVHERELPEGEIGNAVVELLDWIRAEIDVVPTWRDAALSAAVQKHSTPRMMAKIATATATERPLKRAKSVKPRTRRAG
jgi:hypothetical protein